ncbi:hypothetical protein RB195_022420 [Necator americanus]|uniref:Uncharacterized protein n=1 Tax=Necator americanus TaxID=51031 RepID=A0ABR1EFF7_NECAM
MPADRVRKRSRELPVGIRVLTSSPPLARLVPSRSRQLTYTAMICCTCQSSYSLDALLFCIQVPTSTVPLCRGYQQMCEQKQTNNEQIPSNSDFSIMRNS